MMHEALGLKFLYEDQHLVVLSKPAGLDSQGGAGNEDHLVSRLQKYFGRNYVGLVHRLDRNTSGLMVVAKRSKSAQRLSESIKKGDIVRKYLTILTGAISGKITATHWLDKDQSLNKVRIYTESESAPKAAKKSTTLFVPWFSFKNNSQEFCLVECSLETGRSHQIRAQAQAIGHSMLGDTKYGDSRGDFPRPALHSYLLSFLHPMSEERLFFFDTLPQDMLALFPLSNRQTVKTLVEESFTEFKNCLRDNK